MATARVNAPAGAVRTGRWKYIRRFGDKHTPVLPNCDGGLSKSVWPEYGWKNMRLPDESLYDLIFDPNEHNNLAADPAFKTVLTRYPFGAAQLPSPEGLESRRSSAWRRTRATGLR